MTLSRVPPPAHTRPANRRRPTIAVLLDYLGCASGAYHGEVRDAFDVACKRRGYNLMVVIGRALEAPWPGPAACNSVYDLVTSQSADGVVLIAGGLATFSGVAGLQRLCARYRGLPLCSFGVRVPGVASVTIDGAVGMDALMDHVVGEHGCRKVAFIAGPERNPDAAVRFESYRRGLARHGLSFEPRLVERGTFNVGSGASAMKRLLDGGLEIDAVVAANDGMALGVLGVLKERARRVPREILVTGFDDSEMGRFAEPPLTTLRQPLEAMAEASLRLIDRQLAGEQVLDEIALGVEFVPRESCGCRLGQTSRRRATAPPPPEPLGADGRVANAVSLFPRTRRRLGAPAQDVFERLDGAAASLGDALLATVEDCVARAPLGREVEFAEALVEDLRDLEAHLVERTGGAEPARVLDCFGASREFLLGAQLRFQVQRARQVEDHYHASAHAAEMLSSVLDRATLKGALTTELGSLRLERAIILLHPEQGPARLEPFLSWPELQTSELPIGFDPRALMPPEPQDADRHHWLLLPLVSEETQWGVILLEPGPMPVDHERLPALLSSQLNDIALHREIVEKTALHARSVQERQATAERLQALGVLAAGVAHDLNNTLGPLLALPDVMVKELDALKLASEVTKDLRDDLSAIRAATLRASRTIKDLVVLGRQKRARRVPLDLNRIVSACVLGPDAPFARGGHGPRLVLDPESLTVEGSESHLVRALHNLVQNAVDACGGAEDVTVSTRAFRTATPRAGYETIEAGDYALLSVSDRGPGIAHEILGRIFEPFFSRKPLSETSGSGLGLALVHGIVKEHEGFVDVESTPGGGTTFTLYLPRTRLAVRGPSVRPGGPARGAAQILVVDDDPLQVRTARRVLESFGYRATILNSGRAACQLFEQARKDGSPSPFDLVITDVALGEDRDGVEVCEQIRRLFPEQKLLIVSGHAAIAGVTATTPGIAWLLKPYAADELGHAVDGVLDGRSLNPDGSPALPREAAHASAT